MKMELLNLMKILKEDLKIVLNFTQNVNIMKWWFQEMYINEKEYLIMI